MTSPVWHAVGPVAAFHAVPDGDIQAHTVGGLPVAIFRIGEQLHAFLDQCPHRGAPFSESGRVLDGRLVCMNHFWAFTLPEGRQTHLPDVCLTRFPLRITDDVLEVGLPPSPGG